MRVITIIFVFVLIIDQTGLTLIGLHYNINTPLSGTAPGQYNYDIKTKTSKSLLHCSLLTQRIKVPDKRGYTFALQLTNLSGAMVYVNISGLSVAQTPRNQTFSVLNNYSLR